jgi:hypothetical protein
MTEITINVEDEIKKLTAQIQMHYDGMKACEGAIALLNLKVKETKEEAEKKAKELAEKQKQEVKK